MFMSNKICGGETTLFGGTDSFRPIRVEIPPFDKAVSKTKSKTIRWNNFSTVKFPRYKVDLILNGGILFPPFSIGPYDHVTVSSDTH